jgi:hypothetical protein
LTPEELRLLMPQYLYEDGELIPLWPQGPYPVYPREPGEKEYAPPDRSTSGGVQISWWHAMDWFGLRHQDTNKPSGFEFYDPNRLYMDKSSGSGGGGKASNPEWKERACKVALQECMSKKCGGAPVKYAYDIIDKFFKNNSFLSTLGISAMEIIGYLIGGAIPGILFQIAALSFILYWTYYSPACVIGCSLAFLKCEYSAWRKSNQSSGKGFG